MIVRRNTVEELGRKLLEERQARGISLTEISEATHISIGVLKDIEAGNFAKYKGDEQYIKMYLRKYANYLKINADEYVDTYVTLTREISLKELQETEDEIKLKKSMKESKPVVHLSKPKYTKSKKVYENHFGIQYLKYVIIAVVFILIIIIIWYGIKLTQNPSDDFKAPSNTHISGETNQEDDSTNDTVDDQPTVDQPVVPQVSVRRRGVYQYDLVIPSDMQEFTMKFEFVSKTWSQLKVNGKVYSDFESRVYNENSKNTAEDTPETVELTFNVNEVQNIVLRNGNNLYHRYYINDVLIDMSEENAVADATNIIFNVVKE